MNTKLILNILISANYFEEILNDCIPFLIYIYDNIYLQLIYHLDKTS